MRKPVTPVTLRICRGCRRRAVYSDVAPDRRWICDACWAKMREESWDAVHRCGALLSGPRDAMDGRSRVRPC